MTDRNRIIQYKGEFPWIHPSQSLKVIRQFSFLKEQRERILSGTPEQAAAQEKDTYLYEEEYRPWFVWALILAHVHAHSLVRTGSK
jgi:hypothetical protein